MSEQPQRPPFWPGSSTEITIPSWIGKTVAVGGGWVVLFSLAIGGLLWDMRTEISTIRATMTAYNLPAMAEKISDTHGEVRELKARVENLEHLERDG